MEADSLEAARRRLYTDELIVLEESILDQGRIETIEATGETVEDAFKKAQSKVPANAKAETRKVQSKPNRITLLVQADDEEGAGKGKADVIGSVSLFKRGRKGFWGLGKTPNVYQVVIIQPAIVELTFRVHATIRATVRDYLAEDLLESIAVVRATSGSLPEILEILNPKIDSDIQAWLVQLHEFNPASALDVIESVCRNDQKANWQIVIREAYTQASIARARELREQEIRLRDLDVRIADGFGLYSSVDWYPRRQKEPTGLPRYGSREWEYDSHRQPNEQLRKTIPRYSSDREAFSEVERKLRGENLYELYLQALFEEDKDERTASLEQKCTAALKARSSKGAIGSS